MYIVIRETKEKGTRAGGYKTRLGVFRTYKSAEKFMNEKRTYYDKRNPSAYYLRIEREHYHSTIVLLDTLVQLYNDYRNAKYHKLARRKNKLNRKIKEIDRQMKAMEDSRDE